MYYSANQLQNSCKVWQQLHDQPFPYSMNMCESSACLGFFSGAIGTLQILARDKILNPCFLPSNITIEQNVKIFMKWADDNPDKLNWAASDAVLTSYVQAFCK